MKQLVFLNSYMSGLGYGLISLILRPHKNVRMLIPICTQEILTNAHL